MDNLPTCWTLPPFLRTIQKDIATDVYICLQGGCVRGMGGGGGGGGG